MGRVFDTPCLTPDAVERIASGASSSSEPPQVAEHLASCRDCQAAIRCARANECFLGRFLAAASDGSTLGGQSSGTAGSGDPPFGEPSIAGYQILREIRRGGQGVVYEAVRLSTGQRVAIKVLHLRNDRDWNQRMRFEREVAALVKLRHPGVVPIHDRGTVAGRPYLIMDFVPGSTLDEYAARHIPALNERVEIFCQVGDAVQFAHLRGVIHRDLKPSNVIIDEDGHPRLIDFGLAKLLHDSDSHAALPSTLEGQFFGSLPWASPEQARGLSQSVDTRSDIYSLGVILYELTTGQLPIRPIGSLQEIIKRIIEVEPTRPSAINRAIAGDLETIILTCLQKEPARRYQSVSELLRDLRRFQQGEPIEARRDSTWQMIRRSLRRNRIALVVVTSFAAMLLATGAILALSRENARTAERARQANAFSDMSLKLATPDETQLRPRVRNLAPLFAYLEEYPDSEGATRVRQRLTDESKALAGRIRTAIDNLNADEFIDLIADDEDAWSLLQRCLSVTHATAEIPALAAFLEQALLTPPEAGRAARRERHLRALQRIAPEGTAADRARQAQAIALDEMATIYGQDFNAFEVGERPVEWQPTFPDSDFPFAVAEAERSLRIGSRPTMAGSVRCPVESQYDTLRLTMSFRITPLEDSGGSADLNGFVALIGAVGDVRAGQISVCDGRFRCRISNQDDQSQFRYGPVVEAGRAYRLEIGYYRDRSTWDCIIDGSYLAEEAGVGSSVVPQAIELNAGSGCEIRVDDIALRGTNALAKRPLGDVRCRITNRELPLAPAILWPIASTEALWADVDQDGRPEIIAGISGRDAGIEVFKVEPSRLNLRSRLRHALPDFEFVSPQFISPRGLVAACSTPPTADKRRDQTGLIDSRLIRLTFDQNLAVHEQSLRSLPEIDRIVACTVGQGGPNARIAIGRSCYDAGFETVGFAPEGLLENSQPGLSGELSVFDLKLEGDACTVSALDLDQDGDDDLVVGTGFPHGMTPLLVFLEAGQPISCQPMTRRIGQTRALVLRDESGEAYIAAATQSPLRQELERLREVGDAGRFPCDDCGGLRVWRAENVHWDRTSESEACYVEPGNAVALCSGTCNGRTFLFSCFQSARADELRLRVSGYALEGNNVQPAFSVELLDRLGGGPRLHCFDLDQDGNDELLLAMEQRTLVFRLE